MIQDGDCCDSHDYDGHVCLECYFQHCHCPDGIPGPLPLDTEGLWTVSRRMPHPDMSGKTRWASVTRPDTYKETLVRAGRILSLEPEAVLIVVAHVCNYPSQCCPLCGLHTMPHQRCMMR
jgi:hypothetical protein